MFMLRQKAAQRWLCQFLRTKKSEASLNVDRIKLTLLAKKTNNCFEGSAGELQGYSKHMAL
jgi:hypothetical protein